MKSLLQKSTSACTNSKNVFLSGNFQFNRQLDASFLQNFYENDLETAAAMFRIFLRSTLQTCQRIFQTYQQGQYEIFQQLIHKVRARFKMVGLGQLDSIFIRLETADIDQLKQEKARELVKLFQAALTRYLPIIKAEAKRLEKVI